MNEKQLEEQVELITKIAFKMVPKFAEIYKLYYDELIKQGFTEQQAIEIVTKYQVK